MVDEWCLVVIGFDCMYVVGWLGDDVLWYIGGFVCNVVGLIGFCVGVGVVVYDGYYFVYVFGCGVIFCW